MDTPARPDRIIARDRPASGWRRVGMIVPSSNTVLEPVTSRLAYPLGDGVSIHYARLPVLEISLSGASLGYFSGEPALAAARQLADARCDLIVWNGTSASWLGIETDLALAASITDETGIAATTTSLAFQDAFETFGVRRLGLVTPYLSEVQDRIIANYARAGIEVVADRRLEDRGNFTFAEYSGEFVAGLVRDVAAAKPDAVAVVCTNFRGADHVASLEAELGIPVLDSVAVTLWGSLRALGMDPAPLAGHGRLFRAAVHGSVD